MRSLTASTPSPGLLTTAAATIIGDDRRELARTHVIHTEPALLSVREISGVIHTAPKCPPATAQEELGEGDSSKCESRKGEQVDKKSRAAW